jgi:tol-pal system protein YbgF
LNLPEQPDGAGSNRGDAQMNRLTCSAVMLSLFFTGCASQGSLDNVRNDVDSVKTRLFSIERDLGGIRDESKTGLGAMEKTFKTDVAAVRKISADIQANIDTAKSDMQAMQGKLDDIALTAKKPADDLQRYREDADKRILQLEDRILKLQTALEELSRKTGEAATPAKETPPTAEALYMKGLETFKAGDMPAAREILGKFLEKFPKHDLAANANYWIGETYYGEKNYEQAILAFQEVIKNYPQQPKAPSAMLKQAMSFKAINDTKSANYVLKKLVAGYPKSDEAKKAKELMKQK